MNTNLEQEPAVDALKVPAYFNKKTTAKANRAIQYMESLAESPEELIAILMVVAGAADNRLQESYMPRPLEHPKSR
jgi:hypothetical protein